MQTSDTGLAVVMAFEGCLKPVPGRPGWFRPYTCPAGVLTIGWGHTNHHPPRFDRTSVWSQQQCDDALRADLAKFERHVLAQARVPLVQHEFDALVSWAYNTGGPVSAGVWRRLRAGDRAAVPAELAKWNKAGGKVLAGLVRRRKAEAALFAGRADEALRIAGARKPPAKPPSRPAEAGDPPPASAPPAAEPVPAPPRRSFWASLIAAFRRA